MFNFQSAIFEFSYVSTANALLPDKTRNTYLSSRPIFPTGIMPFIPSKFRFLKKLSGTFAFFLLSIILLAQLQSLKFGRLSIQDGLSHSTVFSVIQDQKGFMWFGTQDGGLNKYDGFQFTVFTHDPNDSNSIATNNISKIVEDAKGMIWVGTWGGGLDMYNPLTEKFTHFRNNPNNPNSLSHDNAQTVFEDSRGNIWVGTAGGGLNMLNPATGKFTIYKTNKADTNTISHDRIWSVSEDQKGIIWVGTSNGLNRIDPSSGKIKRFFHDETDNTSISHAKVRMVFVDHAGTVWIGTTKGIDVLDQATGTFEHYYPYPKDSENQETNEVNVIFEDHQHHIWVGTHAGGLCRFNQEDKTFTRYTSKSDNAFTISYNDVRDICEDRSGILWLATRGGGISKVDLKPVKFFHLQTDPENKSGLPGNRIKYISAGKNNVIWLATDGTGMSRYDKSTGAYTNYLHDPANPNSLTSNRLRSVFEDSKGRVWIGTNGSGLNIFDPQTGKFTLYRNDPADSNSIGDDDVFMVAEGKNGEMWIGTDNGLDLFDAQKNTFTHYRNDPDDNASISNNRVWSIYVDREGILWAGTDEGLNRFDAATQTFRQFRYKASDPNSISNNDIYCFNEDDYGGLWVGTGQGLNHIDRKTMHCSVLTTKDGLAGNAVYSILRGDDGHLWVTTITGLSRFDPALKKFRNYYSYDGLQSNEFNPNCGDVSESGFVFVGGNNGFNMFRPILVKDNPYVPGIAFTDFSIENKKVPVGDGSVLQNSITYTNDIQLSYSHSVFSIAFAALSYNVPERNQYAYKLDGFDKDWIYCGQRHDVTYTNLSPGEYTFRVKASNNDGVWNEKGISLRIVIEPPFWQTKWFYALCALLLIGLVYLIIRWRERTLQAEKLVLEKKVESRTEEIRKKNEILNRQKEELADRNRDITDSIRYAKRIQEAILPPEHFVQESLGEHFVFYRPKDIVSGDFYWVDQADGKSLVAAVDCTGHGVPGAFVSIVGNNGLNRAVNEFGLSQPSRILDKLNELVVDTFAKSGNEVKDGMDLSLCTIDRNTGEVQFAGANNPLYVLTPNENFGDKSKALFANGSWLFEIKPDKQAIGGEITRKKEFTNHNLKLSKGESIYLFTDGYADQFGGPKGKKFMYSKLKQLLLSIQDKNMTEQMKVLSQTLDDWRGDIEQVDDVMIIGIRF
jgi:ligand-binding sensor domain-containing protein/serine phosphatase RsbU (regulator of sigma subunit)